MNSATRIIGCLVFTGMLMLSALAQTPTSPKTNTNSQTAGGAPADKSSMTKKTTKTKNAMPTSDADIQTCITKKLAAAPKLKTQGFSVTVSGGVATFIGTAANPGSKGGVYSLAKSCGAKQIVNNITIQKTTKATTPAQGAPTATPKKP